MAEPDAAPAPPAPDPFDPTTLALLRVIAAAAVDAFIVTDADARIQVWNAAAERLYGIDARDAIGRVIFEISHSRIVGDTEVPTWLPREIALTTGNWQGRVIEHPTIGRYRDREVVVEASLSRLADDTGRPQGLLNIKRDITPSYRLEQELPTLGSLATVGGHPRSRAEVAQAAIDLLCTTAGAELGTIVLFDGEGPRLDASHGLDDALRERIEDFLRSGQPLFESIEQPGQVLIGELDELPLRPDGRTWVESFGATAMAVVGIHRAGRQVGVISLSWLDAEGPRPSSAILLQASAHVERALENAQLVEEITRRAEAERALTRRLDVLDELTRVGLAVHTSEELAERSARLVGEALEASGTAYGLFAPDGKSYEATGIADVAQPLVEWLARAAPGERSAVRRWRAGEGSILERFEPGAVTEETLAIARETGMTAYAAIPVRVDGELAGGIVAYFDRPPDDLVVNQAALDSVARIVGISLANFRLRQRLGASETRYRNLFEAAPDAYLVCDRERWIIEANEAAGRLVGLPVEALRGRHISEFLLTDDATRARAMELIATVGRGLFVGLGRRADGSQFPREAEVALLDIDGGTGYLVRIRDLTEQQRLQVELVQAQKMETVGILVSGVAHELNNPIASIIGLSTLIGRDPALSPDLRESAGLLVDEAQRAGQIVRTFLDFVRSRPPERHPTPLGPLIETVRELQSYSQKSGIEWVIDLDRDLPRIAIDRSQIQQVLINLTTNAIQAIQADRRTGRLEINARLGPRTYGRAMVRITVTDNGPGVAISDRTKLFVPFFTTKAPGEGTGLGLPVSFDIVRRHEGLLWYEPAPGGRGARFAIDLPVEAAGPAVVTRPVERPPAPSPLARQTGRSKARSERAGSATGAPSNEPARRPRALILDDEEAIRAFLRKALMAAGFEAVVAADTDAAVAAVRSAPIDVALVDHRMPGLTGIDAYQAAVALQPDLAERWIFMSGDVLNPELQAFAEALGVPVLAKPFDLATITRMATEIVERAGLAD